MSARNPREMESYIYYLEMFIWTQTKTSERHDKVHLLFGKRPRVILKILFWTQAKMSENNGKVHLLFCNVYLEKNEKVD